MLKKYLWIFLISMVPLVELRGAIPVAVAKGLPLLPSYFICILGNILPVPFIFLFARKILEWGKDKRVFGKFFTWCYKELMEEVRIIGSFEAFQKGGRYCLSSVVFSTK